MARARSGYEPVSRVGKYRDCDFCGRESRVPDPEAESAPYCCDAARHDAEYDQARFWLTCAGCHVIVASIARQHEVELVRGKIGAIPFMRLSRPFRIAGDLVYCVDCEYPSDVAGPIVVVGAEMQPSEFSA